MSQPEPPISQASRPRQTQPAFVTGRLARTSRPTMAGGAKQLQLRPDDGAFANRDPPEKHEGHSRRGQERFPPEPSPRNARPRNRVIRRRS